MEHRYSGMLGARLILAALSLPGVYAYAAVTDIANVPLASSSTSSVKPNVMFILDDSGSMAWDYVPDAANNFDNNEYGGRSSHCNGLFYNPAITYLPPVDSTGTSYPNASFTDAWRNGFDTGEGKRDLRGSYYYKYTGTQADLAFTYNSAGDVRDNSTFYRECNSNEGNSPGKNVFTKVEVSATSGPNGTDERTNFANWYSYYRTRILAMKTAAGRAFSSIGSNYRVGLTTINYTGTDNEHSEFLNIDDFDPTHKSTWYSKFYGVTPNSGTPLRAALSKVGRIYAGKVGADPVQYSCQQNFAILSTDGYWNGAAGYQVDGSTAIGDQDSGTTDRPMYDGLKKSDTLADVAMYYYKTDLRTTNCTNALGNDVCTNNVPGAGADKNSQQHMTTFTLGLGINGTLAYAEDYLQGGSADYTAIAQGTKNWPAPQADSQTAVDDLWHAAVNGRGMYFSAQNPASLVSGISKALSGVSARTGSAAAAATSNLEPVAGDNYVYIALYRTVKWDGDLQAKTINPNTGDITETPVWSAQSLLDQKVSATSDTRTIYTFDSQTANKLKPFKWADLSAAERAHFNDMCPPTGTVKLSQCSTLTAAQKTATSGENLVNFLRGQNAFEDEASNAERLYRDREHVLGDMINSQPVYVKKPPFMYVDENYASFRDTTQKNRAAMVYVAVNDGMLHAFNGETGTEAWAYIPPMVMPNLYKLADKNYAANHQFYVDGSPTMGDVCPNAPASACAANEWKTILIGGLNAGGRGYYALDITNPASPKALWNFTAANDSDLGLTYGNPVITKRKDGTWVVVFTSGYNNVLPGSGEGFLFVLNAYTGEVLEKIATGVGDMTTPSGLAKINAWISSPTDNTAARFYGGDMLGNVWRFDVDNVVPPAGKEATRIAELGQVNGAGIQPVTIKPELSEVLYGGTRHVAVHVATGRFLGEQDRGDTSQQSIYTLKDTLTDTGLGLVRNPGVLVKQTLITITKDGEQIRTTSSNEVDWSTHSGWYVDLNPNNESPGERVNVDMQQQLGLLTVAANVPDQNACNSGGYAYKYSFDFKTGTYVKTAANNMVGRRISTNALVAGIKTIKLTTGKTVTLVTDTGGTISPLDDPSSGSGAGGDAKRVSWRELL